MTKTLTARETKAIDAMRWTLKHQEESPRCYVEGRLGRTGLSAGEMHRLHAAEGDRLEAASKVLLAAAGLTVEQAWTLLDEAR